jgi:ADP-heptose:LPS heptosyltransferase
MRLKRLEQWWRRVWIRLLVRLMRRPENARPNWGTRPTRVLFLRHDRAGDMILSTGVMRAIASSYTTVTLDVLASPINASLVEGADYLAEVIVFDKKRLSSYLPTALRLRRARYDAVIDCMVTAPSVTTLLLILASGARYRVGIAGRGNDAAFNVTVPNDAPPGTHMVDRLAALARAFDVEVDGRTRQPSLQVTPNEQGWAASVWGTHRSPRVLINISAGGADRVWPDERYVAVMRHIHAKAPSTVIKVIASPAEAARGEAIARGGQGEFVKTRAIRDAMALVATADFVFTPDTSIAHAVSAFQRPAVAIYGRGKKAEWALHGTIGRSIEHTGKLPELGLERVLTAIDEVWSEAGLSRG